MKRIIVILALLLSARVVHAGTCEEQLGVAFSPNQRISLCNKLGANLAVSQVPVTSGAINLGSASKKFNTIFLGGVNQAPNTVIFASTPVAGTNLLLPGYNIPAATATANHKVFIGAAIPTPGEQYEFYNASASTLQLAVPTIATMNGATQGGYLAVATKLSASCKTVSGTNIECRLNVNPTPAGP
jgi:hypothetical protein